MHNPFFLQDEHRGLYKQNRRRALAAMREEYVRSRVPLDSLCEFYGAPVSEVRRRVESQRWEQARLKYSSQVFASIEAARTDVNADEFMFLHRIKQAGIASLTRFLETLSTSSQPIDLDEADKISKIIERMSKLENLKRGQPTSISATKSLEDDISPEDFQKAMKAISSPPDAIDDVEQ